MSRTIRIALPIALMVAGAAMIVFGIYHEEITVILRKAIYICLECIGLG